jgi:hypothetical protein
MIKPVLLKLALLVCFAVLTGACNNANEEQNIFVSPDGNDDNNGTIESPFLTLERAKKEVRKLKQGSKEPITVLLRGGTYLLTKTVVFSLEDSGTEGSPVSYQAFQDEVPVFTSSVEIEGWKKARNLPQNFPESTRNRIWVAVLPKGQGLPKYLFREGNVLPRSLTRGFIPPVKRSGWRGASPADRNQLVYEKGIIKNWDHIQDMELAIMPTCDWTFYNLPLQKVDETSFVVKTAFSGSYGLGAQQKKTWDGENTAWFANCPEGMLEEGNWYVSQSENRVYLVLSGDTPPSDITMPALQEYFKVEGIVGKDLKEDTPVRYLNFIGLVFANGERDTWDENHLKNHIQHEWERYDHGDALLRLRGAENCVVSGCQFVNSGGTGVRLDLHCQNITVENSAFHRLGGCGILLCGYGIGYKDVNKNNLIRNNHISFIGEAYRHSSAITIFQSGENLVANNTIQHTPYNGITITGPRSLSVSFIESGGTALIDLPESKSSDWDVRFEVLHSRNNLVKNNDISYCVEFLGDGNAVYLSGCGENNILRHNYIHDILNPHASAAVRTDAMTRSVRFENNLFYNLIHSAIALKDVNHATDNIMIDASKMEHSGYLVFRAGPSDNSEVTNNIFICIDSDNTLFIADRPMRRLPPADMSKAIIENNVCYIEGMNDQGHITGIFKLGIAGGKYQIIPVEHSERQMKLMKIEGITISEGRPKIDVSAPVFEQGHLPFDLLKVGLISDHDR